MGEWEASIDTLNFKLKRTTWTYLPYLYYLIEALQHFLLIVAFLVSWFKSKPVRHYSSLQQHIINKYVNKFGFIPYCNIVDYTTWVESFSINLNWMLHKHLPQIYKNRIDACFSTEFKEVIYDKWRTETWKKNCCWPFKIPIRRSQI